MMITNRNITITLKMMEAMKNK